MNRLNRIIYFLMLNAVMFSLISCNEEKGKTIYALDVISIEGSGPSVLDGKPITVDLTPAKPPVTDAPIDITLKITFNKDVNATTVKNKSAYLYEGEIKTGIVLDDDKFVEVKTTVSGALLTLTATLKKGTKYTLVLDKEIKAIETAEYALFSGLTRTFTTGGDAE